MRRVPRLSLCVALVLAACAGCRNPFANPQANAWQQAAGEQNPQMAQLQELNRRVTKLDQDNRELLGQISHLEVLRDENALLRKQLGDTAQQLKDIQVAKSDAEQRLSAHQASLRQRGSAQIRANNSVTGSLQAVDIPGFEVKQEDDLVRITIPADRLFTPGTAQLQSSAAPVLDQVAEAVRRNYPQQVIGIEGHTDNTPSSGVVLNNHQLSVSQALAVFDYVSRSGRLATEQMFIMGSGGNQPLFSNGDPAARAKNRRVSIVIYPETVNGR